MKNMTFLTALLCGSASVAQAGGYVPQVADAAPAVVVSDAFADWTGFYAGVQVGGAELKINAGSGVNQGFDGRHYGAHVGYLRDYGRFVSGVELSYDKLNNFDFFDQFGGLSGNFIRAKILAGYDSGRFLPYAALSYARLTFSEGNPIFDFRETGLGFGLGAKFMASPRVLLGVEWMTNNLDIPAGGGTTDLDLNNFTVSASYRF